MMRIQLATCTAWLAISSVSLAQRQVPVRDLEPADATSDIRFSRIMNIRVLSDGTVLVNDGGRRQLIALDAALGSPLTLLDSTPAAYGRSPGVLFRGRADSLLFVSRSLMAVIEPGGRVASTTMAAKKPLITSMQPTVAGMDSEGRIAYRAVVSNVRPPSPKTDSAASTGATASAPPAPPAPDSMRGRGLGHIVRGDFTSRSLQKVATFRVEAQAVMSMNKDESGRTTVRTVIRPLPVNDDYVVLSDGTVAVVRNDDYHVDFYFPDGTSHSAPPIVFARQMLTIAQRQAIIDSARTAQLNAEAAGIRTGEREGAAVTAAVGVARATGIAGSNIGDGFQVNVMRADSIAAGAIAPTRAPAVANAGVPVPTPTQPPNASQRTPPPSGIPFAVQARDLEYVPLEEMPTRYPVFLGNALVADEDDNIWVHTTAPDPKRNGAHMYDVINKRGALVQHVRVPAGKAIVGFGKDMVFLTSQGADGITLQRAPMTGRLPR